MIQSFTAVNEGGLVQVEDNSEGRRRVLVTGAAGRIGSYFTQHSHEKYDLRLVVQNQGDETKIKDFGEVVVGDLADLQALKHFCAGIDTVVHMAGNPDANATWSELLAPNIIGVYNIMTAAKAAGCRRLIFASSIHAVSGRRNDVQVKTSEPVAPGDLYGVSKAFGEALGAYMALQEGLSVIALRIGGFQSVESAEETNSISSMDAFVSKRDLNQLINKCIDDVNLKYAVFHGLSNNRFNRLDISDARDKVGYEPQDDLTDLHPQLKELDLNNAIYKHNLESGQQSGLRDDL